MGAVYRKHIVSFDAARRSCTTAKTYAPYWEVQPFDGMILDATMAHAQLSGAQPLSNWTASDYAPAWSEFSTSLADAQAIPFRKFSENFIMTKMQIVSGYTYMDWYLPSVSAFIWQMRMAARFAKLGQQFRGVFFDPEPNVAAGQKLWNYSDRPMAGTYTFQQYQAICKQWGAWTMEAMQDEFPDMILIIAFSWYQAVKQNNPPISTDTYGLFGSFLDGMFDAASQRVQIHDYYEDGYGHYQDADIAADLAIMNSPSRGIATTKRINGRYFKSYASYLDTLTSTNLGAGIQKSQQQIVDRLGFVYANTHVYMGATGAGTATQAEVDAIKNTRITLGLDYADDITVIPGRIADVNPAQLAGQSYNDGDAISTYTDDIGNVYTQSGGNRPVYKANTVAAGVPSILFAKASSQNLVCDGLPSRFQALSQDIPFTAITAVKCTANGANEAFWGFGNSASANTEQSLSQTSGTIWRHIISDDSGGNTVVSSTTSADTNLHLVTVIYSGTTFNLRVDGANVIATNSYFAADYGAMTLNKFRLGSRGKQTVDLYFGGHIVRFYLNKNCLGLKDVHYLERIFARAYGITIQHG